MLEKEGELKKKLKQKTVKNMGGIYPAMSITMLYVGDLDAPNQIEIVKLRKEGQYPIIC